MRRKTLIALSVIVLAALLLGVVAEVIYIRRQRDAAPAFSEVHRYLHDGEYLRQLPQDRAWTLSNIKEEPFTGPAPSGWLAGKEGEGRKEFLRTKYAFKDRSGILTIVHLSSDGGAINGLKVIGAPADEDAFRAVLLEKFPDLERYHHAHP